VATPLVDRLARRAPAAAAALGAPAAGEPVLAALCAEAAAAWAGVAVDPADVIDALADRLAADDAVAITAAAVAELHLAIACARGDAAAIVAFDRAYLDVVPRALAAMKLPAATVDDVRATVRDRLLLADGDAPPRVLGYAGRGRLRGLVQVAATRAAIDRTRTDHRDAPLPAGDRVAAAGDLELSLIKAQYRGAFAAGVAAAIAGLDRRDRNLLRLHFLGGVTLDALAQIHGVHRATIVRWLAAARAAVMTATRGHVAAAIGAPADELDAMFALVESRAELSLERMLASVETSRGR
jgi:RNA polymerase sigma-70 factor, ECF subfamily